MRAEERRGEEEDCCSFVDPPFTTTDRGTESDVHGDTSIFIRLGSYGIACLGVDGFFGHNGNIPGYQSTMYYNPDTNFTVVVSTNLNQRKSGVTPADCLTREIFRALDKYESNFNK